MQTTATMQMAVPTLEATPALITAAIPEKTITATLGITQVLILLKTADRI